MINMSKDTLLECWFAPLYDTDIATKENARSGSANDRCRYFSEIDSLNLAVSWSGIDQQEEGKGFGYIGFELLQSPAIKTCERVVHTTLNGIDGDFCSQCTKWELQNGIETCVDSIIFDKNETGNLRKDKSLYQTREQLGMVTFLNWPVDIDPHENTERYDLISLSKKDGDTGPGDKRVIFSTGPYNMLPGDTVSIWIGLVFALPSVKQEADGSAKDMGLSAVIDKKSLLGKILKSRKLFNNGMITTVEEEKNKSEMKDSDFEVYPNPANEFIVLEAKSSINEISHYEIFNIHGERILSCNNPDFSNNRTKINLTGIGTGTYLIKVCSGYRISYVKFSIIK
jgi:hypothetical protein